VLLSVLLFVVGFPATPVLAHSTFLGSDPVNGSVLEASPRSVRLDFDEPVLIRASSARLIHLGTPGDTDLPIAGTNGDLSVVATLPELADGGYILRFTVVDPADLHRTVGSVSFGVGVEAPPTEQGRQIGGSFLSIVARAAANVLLLLTVGAALLMQFGAADSLGRAGRRRVARWAARAAAGLCLTWLVLLIDEAAAIGWSNLSLGSLLINSDPGRRFIIGVQLALGLWWASRLLARTEQRSGEVLIERIIGLISLGFVAIAAFAGHAAIGGNRWVGIGLRFAHLLALCVWIGGVAVAAFAVRRRTVDEPERLWRFVSRNAAIALAVVGVTGLLLSGRLVETVTALLTTTYGIVIIAKIVGLLLLSLFGLRAARRVAFGKQIGDRFLGVELGIGVVVLILAAVLAASPPARGEQFLPLLPPSPQVATADVADLLVSASLFPAQPGPNLLEIRVLDTRRPSPGPIKGVTVVITSGSGTEVSRLEGVPVNGLLSWSDVSLPAPGTYDVNLTIDRVELPPPPFDGSFDVAPPPVPRVETVVSDRSLMGIVVPIALGWVVLVGAVAFLLRRARRGRSGTA
jgi:putative copper export protein/methionine-rich copper-binding protein CopC